jgi:hypothetical protein
LRRGLTALGLATTHPTTTPAASAPAALAACPLAGLAVFVNAGCAAVGMPGFAIERRGLVIDAAVLRQARLAHALVTLFALIHRWCVHRSASMAVARLL